VSVIQHRKASSQPINSLRSLLKWVGQGFIPGIQRQTMHRGFNP
jgi:hypothetical protein